MLCLLLHVTFHSEPLFLCLFARTQSWSIVKVAFPYHRRFCTQHFHSVRVSPSDLFVALSVMDDTTKAHEVYVNIYSIALFNCTEVLKFSYFLSSL